MASAHELQQVHERLRALIEFALSEGWRLVRTPCGGLHLSKGGSACLYTVSMAGTHHPKPHFGAISGAVPPQEVRRG